VAAPDAKSDVNKCLLLYALLVFETGEAERFKSVIGW